MPIVVGAFFVGGGIDDFFLSDPFGSSSGILLVIGGLVGLALYILLIVWLATRGGEGPNRFGDDPMGRGDASVFE